MTRQRARAYTPWGQDTMIYLDYAATAPLRPSVTQAVSELCGQTLGNPSSLHRAGRQARFHLEEARERCAHALGAKVEEIVFCSGATEADNLALFGPLEHPETRHHGLITSELEHAAVFEAAAKLARCGHPVRWLQVSPSAQVLPDLLQVALTENPRQLVSVMACNNEVGSRQPLGEVSGICEQHGALLHVDAVQDPGLARSLIESGQVHLLSLSGHKMGGLPGGLLYVRQGVPLAPQVVGGAQEDSRRAGTSEVLRAVSLATSLEATLAEDRRTVRRARELLESRLQDIPGARRLGPVAKEQRGEHISAWLFARLDAEPILAQLDMLGVCASSGSACSSHAVEPSRVVKAMGLGERAMGLVRFSFGWKTTLEETERAAGMVRETVMKMLSKEKVAK